jgi:class 3 adenylate cyclase/pimeloyl-ACP methyl ester carboxylesterase
VVLDIPEVRYTTTADGVSIAYQLVGDGSLEIVYIDSAWTSNVELGWDFPLSANLRRGLAARGRAAWFDRRGSGLSDPVSGEHLPTLEARMDDIRAVMDAAGFERPILAGFEDASSLCFLFAATHPERTRALVAVNAVSRGLWASETPWLWTEDQWAEEIGMVERGWGTTEFSQDRAELMMPEFSKDPGFLRGYARLVRNSLSKADALAAERMWRDTDVRDVLPLIQAPTLVLHLAHVASEAPEESRYVADHIPGARFVQLQKPELDWAEFFSSLDPFLASLREEDAEFDRVLATVVFTDIVDSTAQAAAMGDRRWREVQASHDAIVRSNLGRYRGREIKTMGDGFLLTFDGPARAIRCADAIVAGVVPLGIEVRAGLHTGEVTLDGGDIAGLGVAIGARVGAKAGPSEVLVSQTVKDLVAGSGLTFEDAGEHELKGVPDRWRLYRVVA